MREKVIKCQKTSIVINLKVLFQLTPVGIERKSEKTNQTTWCIFEQGKFWVYFYSVIALPTWIVILSFDMAVYLDIVLYIQMVVWNLQ